MTTLPACLSCRGFVPPAATECPHCDASLSSSRAPLFSRQLLGKIAKTLITVTASSSFAVTLMACYGSPCVSEDATDNDGDGFTTDFCERLFDCDDEDATINPGAEDPLGDGIDQNCDGEDGVFDPDADAGPATDAGYDSGVFPGQERDAGNGG